MKKKLQILWIVCLLTICMVLPVCAASPVLFAGYVIENKIYIFCESEEALEARLYIGEKQVNGPGGQKNLESLMDSGQRVHYFLLLDRSTSMAGHMEEVKEFVSELLDDTQTKKVITLMSFGDAFQPELEDSVDEDAVQKKLEEISCDEKKTNLYKGIWSALDYVEERGRREGELCRMILLTDGIPYEASEEPDSEQVVERVSGTSDMVFDTLGLGEWKPEDLQTYPIGRSIQSPSEQKNAAAIADELAQETDGLYTACFELDQSPTGTAMDIRILFPIKGDKIETAVPIRKSIAAHTLILQEENEPDQEALEEDKEDQREEDVFEDNTSVQPAESDEQEELPDITSEKDWKKQLLVYGFFLLGGILLGGGLVLAIRRSSGKDGQKIVKTVDSNGIRLCVDVISGRCSTKKREFYPEEEILIGSGRQCDLIWKDTDVSERNSRIFLRDGIVWIEDLDSTYGTAIGGMRIYAPNRLRDGDLVSIGRVQFKVLLEQRR